MLVEHFWIQQNLSLPPCASQPSQPTPSLPVAILMPRKRSDSVFNISQQSFHNSLCGSSPLQKKACLHSSADFNLCLTQQSFILILVLSCEPSVNCFTCLSLQVHLLESFVHTFREGDGTPLQYSWLENPMDGGASWAAVHGVANGQTQLSDWTCMHAHGCCHQSFLRWPCTTHKYSTEG